MTLPVAAFASPTALLAHRLATAPAACAFVIDGQPLSVAGFAQQVRRSEAWLAEQGVGRGDVVAVWLVNRLEWLALYFALARRGAALMTVNTRYRGPELAYLLARAQPKLLVMQPRFRGIDFTALAQEADPASAASLQAVVLLDAAHPPQDPPQDPPQAPAPARDPHAPQAPATLLGKPVRHWTLQAPGPADAAAHRPADALTAAAADAAPHPALADCPSILFTTSGTTSGPKLVQHTQRTVALHVQAIAPAMGMDAPDAVLLAALPFAGTFGFVSMLAAFGAGRPVVVHPTWDAAEAAAAIPRHRVTHFFGSDEMLEGLLGALPPDDPRPLPTLRLLGFAAFRASAPVVAEAARARGLPVAGLYGSSEVHALFSIQRLQRPGLTPAEQLEAGGTPVNPAAEVSVRHPETGARLPPGEVGLLAIRSPSNFIGYLRNDAATAQAIDAEGWFHTGDIGRLRGDGSFVYLTRAGDAIRLGGYLVAPAEIEEALQAAGAPHGLTGAQVVAVELAGKMRAVAFVTRQPGATPPDGALPAVLLAALKTQLAAYKLPVRIWVVDAFPVVLSANGTKIQRTRLRDEALQRLADEAAPPA